MSQLIVRFTLLEELLGSKPYDAALFDRWINGLRRDAKGLEELQIAKKTFDTLKKEASDKAEEREMAGTTVFHRDPTTGKPIIYDYQVKGFFKGACGFLQRADDFNGGTPKSAKTSKEDRKEGAIDINAYKKIIDGLIFPSPRLITLNLPEGTSVGLLERSMRVMTPKGERICLARSETVPAGTTFDVTILFLKKGLEPIIREWLEYGQLHGFGQWRNAGYGRVSVEILS